MIAVAVVLPSVHRSGHDQVMGRQAEHPMPDLVRPTGSEMLNRRDQNQVSRRAPLELLYATSRDGKIAPLSSYFD